MLRTALIHDGPAFIRYPRGAATGSPAPEASALTFPIGRAEVVRAGVDVQLWALGPMVADALALAEKLAAEDGLSVGVVNARFAKPLDRELLLAQAADARLIVTLEDAVATGGFGTAVLETLSEAGASASVERIGWPDTFVGHASSVAELRAAHGLSPAQMLARVRARLGLTAKAPALA
jgi:1-deoxy-D-xylulose-5-phosphate synthase